MSFPNLLAGATERHRSLLCVGLDPDPAKLPAGWQGDSTRLFDFCARIVDATKDLVCAYKPQIAYFAAHRAEDQLERLMAYLRRVAPEVPVILDAKRGDHRADGRAIRPRGLRALPGRRGHALALHGLRFDRALPEVRRQGPDPAVPHLQPRRQRSAGPDAGQRRPSVRACGQAGGWARGIATAASAWWWAPPSRPSWPGCASWRRRCRC